MTCLTVSTFAADEMDPAEAQRWQRLEPIAARAAEVHDLEARFEQQRHTPLLRRPIVSKGRVRIHDQVMRWDTEGEHPSVLQMRPQELRIYYPRQKAMEIYRISDQLGRLASSPLPRLAELKEQFALESVVESDLDLSGKPAGPAASVGPPLLVVTLSPREAALAEHVQRVRVAVDPKTGLAEQIELVQADDERTLLRFSAVKTNIGLKPQDVALEPPPGTKVTRPLDNESQR